MSADRLEQQLAFLTEIDRLKTVERSTQITDGSRVENSAEHSWHLALYALILSPYAAENVDIFLSIRMLLLHDLVEIDVGDHPIDVQTDWAAVAEKELVAAKRIFGLLPNDQAHDLLAIWTEFEAAETPSAKFAKYLDWSQPIFMTLFNPDRPDAHIDVVMNNLETGRASVLRQEFPEVHSYATRLLGWSDTAPEKDFQARIDFLAEMDKLKSVLRATTLCDASRRENSGEHSWHIAMYALILGEHADRPMRMDRVLKMILIHDLVEIDAGDKPIHGDHDTAKMAMIEQAAADRIFGILPTDQRIELRALWEEFEAAESDDAVFAKSIDRVQPVIANLETGGGSWIEYNVSRQQLEDRVGWKVAKGAPALWSYLQGRLRSWFAQNA
ncbi:hypothetical protein NBRC116601_08630 [Cognatishimia sp. WU-CL00825]|uniref:HD domain-containing protein n=1 Tax=Cognatishimia sp. WU-CL00825 TaxID=3127658 RepID=UPI003104C36C